VALLKGALTPGNPVAMRSLAAECLADVRTPEAVRAVELAYDGKPDSPVRWAAVRLGLPAAWRAHEAALFAPGDRFEAVVALGVLARSSSLRSPRVGGALVRGLEQEPEREMRDACAWAAAQLGVTEARPALERRLAADDDLRGVMAWALGRLAGPAAVPALEARARRLLGANVLHSQAQAVTLWAMARDGRSAGAWELRRQFLAIPDDFKDIADAAEPMPGAREDLVFPFVPFHPSGCRFDAAVPLLIEVDGGWVGSFDTAEDPMTKGCGLGPLMRWPGVNRHVAFTGKRNRVRGPAGVEPYFSWHALGAGACRPGVFRSVHGVVRVRVTP
jgi:hypothetical protein